MEAGQEDEAEGTHEERTNYQVSEAEQVWFRV